VIKRYCKKKDIFEPLISIGQGKILTNHKSMYFMFVEIHGSKNIFFIAISFYLFIAILCAKISSVDRALMGWFQRPGTDKNLKNT